MSMQSCSASRQNSARAVKIELWKSPSSPSSRPYLTVIVACVVKMAHCFACGNETSWLWRKLWVGKIADLTPVRLVHNTVCCCDSQTMSRRWKADYWPARSTVGLREKYIRSAAYVTSWPPTSLFPDNRRSRCRPSPVATSETRRTSLTAASMKLRSVIACSCPHHRRRWMTTTRLLLIQTTTRTPCRRRWGISRYNGSKPW